jgi:hypothetical protein
VTLVCEGTVLLPFQAKPTSVNFGRIARGDEAKKQTVTLTRGDGGPIHPEIVRSGSKEIEATLREVEPGERYDLDIQIQPPWPNNRRLRSWVRLKTGVSQLPETTVSVYAEVVPKVEAQPQWFSARLGAAKDLESSVTLQWSDRKLHDIQEVSVDDPDLKVRVETNEESQNVVLTVPAGYQSPARTRTVTIKTGDEEVPILRVPIRFSGQRRSAKANRAQEGPQGVQRGGTAKAPKTTRATKTADTEQAPKNEGDSANAQGDAKRNAGAPNAETTTNGQSPSAGSPSGGGQP